jgi:delta 1-pyrroline-5-carboxylate dehydrogenase
MFNALYSEWQDAPPAERSAIEVDMATVMWRVENLAVAYPLRTRYGKKLRDLVLEVRAVMERVRE